MKEITILNLNKSKGVIAIKNTINDIAEAYILFPRVWNNT